MFQQYLPHNPKNHLRPIPGYYKTPSTKPKQLPEPLSSNMATTTQSCSLSHLPNQSQPNIASS